MEINNSKRGITEKNSLYNGVQVTKTSEMSLFCNMQKAISIILNSVKSGQSGPFRHSFYRKSAHILQNKV